MDPATAAVATLFAALVMLIFGLFAWLRADMRRMGERMEGRLAALGHGMTKMEGLPEGLREAIAGRTTRAAAE